VSTARSLTTTSYAVLGLLAVRPWSTYELTRQMDRSLGRIWPRARSKLYEEPKKLVDLGLARATSETAGRRSRTTYRITAKGRRALAGWLAEPGDGPVLAFEGLTKVFFSDHGSRESALASITAARAWAAERNEENLAVGRAYLAGEGEFQDRAAINLLSGRFLTDFYLMVDAWAAWATDVVHNWPDDPSRAVLDRDELRATVERATWSERPERSG
jgi:DNA-binding PadR family transcriptional regulator